MIPHEKPELLSNGVFIKKPQPVRVSISGDRGDLFPTVFQARGVRGRARCQVSSSADSLKKE